GANTPICAGETLNFTATTSTSGVSWSWNGPGSFSSSNQNPSITNTTTAMSGDYMVAAILNGCNRKDTITVLVKPLPAPVTASNNSPVCAGDTLKVFSTASTGGVTYSWTGPNSFNAGTQNSFVNGATTAATGWYRLTVDLNGCITKDSTNATVHPIPGTPNVSYSTPMCAGETLQLNASTVPGATYTWTGVGGYNANTQNPTRSNMQFGDTGTYSVTASANGCTSPTGSIKVNINPVPFVVIFPTPGDSICVGEQASFTALPNNHGGTPTYKWYVNGVLTGGNSTAYSSTTLNNGDVVRVDITENTKCRVNYTDPSNDVEMKVLPWLAPSVTITANPNRPLNVDEYITFTATPVNGGNNPRFQWKRNGQDVQGATGPQWSANTLNDNDSISVELISGYRCPQPSTASSNGIRVKVLTGVGDIAQKHNLALYPNPNNGSFILSGRLNTNKPVHLDIINALGQVVHSETITANTNELHKEIQLPNIANGIYLLRVNVDGEITGLRFRVER
ncbi:MAG: T9SS type A sorting domain-containing protein, partial [Taibaiella sp.]|nr:T9SS type A sorting domain-containing protein [Taibaiella sp.]